MKTRMHSSRMRTACSSSRPGGYPPGIPLEAEHPPRPTPQVVTWEQAPPRDPTPPVKGTPREQAPTGAGTTPVDTHTTCKNIALPATTYAGGNETVKKLDLLRYAFPVTPKFVNNYRIPPRIPTIGFAPPHNQKKNIQIFEPHVILVSRHLNIILLNFSLLLLASDETIFRLKISGEKYSCTYLKVDAIKD